MSTSSNGPRSIHDAEIGVGERLARQRRQKQRRVPRWVVVGSLLGMFLLGGGAAFRLLSPAPVDGPARYEGVVVVLDGWSVATVGSDRIGFSWTEGSSGEVKLRPVSVEQVSDVLAHAPQAGVLSLARQVTDSPSVSCSERGCAVDGVGVSGEAVALADESEASVRLRASGVEAGLFYASVPVSGASGQLAVGFPGYDSLVVDGVGEGDWVVAAAGLGQVFSPQFAWVDTGGEFMALAADAVGSPAGNATELALGGGNGFVATSGLREVLPAAKSWTSSQLTYATSPSVGCRAGILCFPGTIEVGVTDAGLDAVPVVNADEVPGVMVLSDLQVEGLAPAAFHQQGEGVVEGDFSLRFVTAVLLQGAEIIEVDRAGTVSTSDADEYSPSNVLEQVSFLGEQWSEVK